MVQLLHFVPYVASFLFGLRGDMIRWALALTIASTPLHLWMRDEGHKKFGFPKEDWSPESFTLLIAGQLLIHVTLYGVGAVIGSLLGLLGLV
ncbi:MAG: hypothetical protein GDA47_05460 [Rhodospirillales bacterium]|nr:hypothetical protein [Rhodospirillales bacterium]